MTALGVAVCGLGFMGRTHVRAYHSARAAGLPCELVAVCDQDPGLRSGRAAQGGNLGPGAGEGPLFDASRVRAHAEPRSLAADPAVHAVSLCTPTDTHVDLAILMLQAGKHVLVEKPVGLRSQDVRRLADAARASGRTCMPAMCMRFWSGWDWIQARAADGSLGRIVSASFTRLGAQPGWSRDFYGNLARTGGALFDMHVHDTDFVYWLFGRPAAVTSVGSIEHLHTQYHFDNGPCVVTAEGGWVAPGAFPFRIRCTVEFEHAVVDYDLARDNTLTVSRADRVEAIPFTQPSAYEGEVRHFIEACAAGKRPLRATIDDALAVTGILEAERRSLETGERVLLP